MSGFALPTDPDEKKRKLKEAKEEAAKPKVPPEQESVHRMIFALVLYVCLMLLLVLLIPTVGSAFDTSTRGVQASKVAVPSAPTSVIRCGPPFG